MLLRWCINIRVYLDESTADIILDFFCWEARYGLTKRLTDFNVLINIHLHILLRVLLLRVSHVLLLVWHLLLLVWHLLLLVWHLLLLVWHLLLWKLRLSLHLLLWILRLSLHLLLWILRLSLHLHMDSLWNCFLCSSNWFLVFQRVTPVSDIESKPEPQTTRDKYSYNGVHCIATLCAHLTFINSSKRPCTPLEYTIVVNGHSVLSGVVIATVFFGVVCAVDQAKADHCDEYNHDEVCDDCKEPILTSFQAFSV